MSNAVQTLSNLRWKPERLLWSLDKASTGKSLAILDGDTEYEAMTIKGMGQILFPKLVCPWPVSAAESITKHECYAFSLQQARYGARLEARLDYSLSSPSLSSL